MTAPRVAAAVALGLLAACGGGGGGGGVEPRGTATLTAPTFVTAPEVRESVDLELTSDRAASALQVDLVADPAVIPSAAGIVSAGRATDLEPAFQNVAPGRIRLVLFDPGGAPTLPAGQGPVLRVSFRVTGTAPAGSSALGFEDPIVVDGDGETFDVTVVAGEVIVQR
ncbi:MAG: hypothetical protein H0V09_09670 [Gemmatimonadetes bacterium]|nr:hypothetical protein [Gemmatimonadota bacterium]